MYYELACGKTGALLSYAHERRVFPVSPTTFTAYLQVIALGLRGMQRRIVDYPRGIGFETPNLVSSLGVAVMTVGVLLFLWDVWWCRRNGTPAGNDPWGGHSLEWATTSPPPHHNFARVPRIRSERPAFDLRHPELVP